MQKHSRNHHSGMQKTEEKITQGCIITGKKNLIMLENRRNKSFQDIKKIKKELTKRCKNTKEINKF